MALVKSQKDLQSIRKAGKLLGEVLGVAEAMVKPGVTLLEIEAVVAKAIRDRHATPSFLGYEDYPATSCLSINDELVHGIPRDISLKEGDIVGIDAGLWFEGVCVDSAVTVPVGKIDSDTERLLMVTNQALHVGIASIKPFARVGSISAAIQAVAEEAGLGIVRTLTGHGVGHAVHEEPSVPNYGRPGDGMLLKPGMVLAIEPMFTLGNPSVITDSDGWTIRTHDGSKSAQFEHTVIITQRGAEIVTGRPKTLAL